MHVNILSITWQHKEEIACYISCIPSNSTSCKYHGNVKEYANAELNYPGPSLRNMIYTI